MARVWSAPFEPRRSRFTWAIQFHIIHPSGDHSTRLNPYTVHWNAPATRQFLKNRQAVPSYLGNIWQVPEPVHWQYSCQKHLCTRYHNGRKAGQNPFSAWNICYGKLHAAYSRIYPAVQIGIEDLSIFRAFSSFWIRYSPVGPDIATTGILS